MTTAERIYAASIREGDASARLPEQLARRIEDEIARNGIPSGGGVGSLEQLSERYRVGRAAVREAAALLERRGLGRLRPGPFGGLMVAHPDARASGTELANFLRIAGITGLQVADAYEALDPTASGLAAAAHKASGLEDSALQHPDVDTLDWHLALRTELALLSHEPAIELFVIALNDLTAEFLRPGIIGAAPPARSVVGLRDAVAEGDGEPAMTAMAQIGAGFYRRLGEASCEAHPPHVPVARTLEDRSLSTSVARRIAAEILEAPGAGSRLGSEWDLCDRFSVSRTTLRQAIRQLQDSGLVRTRRGRGNGLVASDLQAAGSIRTVLAFLIGRQMDPMQAGTLLFQLNRFVPTLAVSRADAEQRARLRQMLDRVQHCRTIDRCDLLGLVQCVSQLADSPILDLFSRCLAAYEARFHPMLLGRLNAGMQKEYFELLRRLLDCPADGGDALAAAKLDSAQVMLEMSRSRPI